MKIKDICTGVTDGSHNPPQGISVSDCLMLSSKNIFDNQITLDDPRYLSEEDFEREHRRTNVSAGDVLLTIVGTVGRAAVVGEDMPSFTLQRSVAVLHPKKEVCSSKYLMYSLQSKRSYIESRAKGVAQKGIYLKEVSNIDLRVVPMSEQQIIVATLDKVSSVIAMRTAEIQKLDDLIKARFIELFGSLKEEQLLGDMSEFVTVGIANSATHAYAESGIPMLRNQNIKENHLDDSDLIYIKPKFAAKYESKKLRENDIIAMRTGYPGVACLVPKKYEGCQTFTTLIVRLKPDNNPSYVCSYINSDLGKQFIESEKVGVAQQNVGAKSLAKMPIKIAPKELQDEYADFVKQVDKSKVAVQAALDKAQLLFDSLMQEYFG